MKPTARLKNERGSTIVFVAVSITALMSVVALAIDVGMIFTAKSEAQRAADSAALAGAGSLIAVPSDDDRAKQIAVEYGEQNRVRDLNAEIREDDVLVDLALQRVTVTVRRTTDRGSAVTTWFARVFGINEVDVAARATAEVARAGGAACVKPWTIPDGFQDLDGDGEYDVGEYYEASQTGWGTSYRNGLPSDNGIDPAGTIYTNDRGRPMVLKPGSPHEAALEGWYFPYNAPQSEGSPDVGADRYYWNIVNCNTNIILLGQAYMVENGNMSGPTKKGTNDLYKKDPDAYWDFSGDSVAGSRYSPWEASPRVGKIPLYDPRLEIDPGKNPVEFNNITAFFVEEENNGNVVGRFLYATGVGVGNPGEAPESAAKFARLVE